MYKRVFLFHCVWKKIANVKSFDLFKKKSHNWPDKDLSNMIRKNQTIWGIPWGLLYNNQPGGSIWSYPCRIGLKGLYKACHEIEFFSSHTTYISTVVIHSSAQFRISRYLEINCIQIFFWLKLLLTPSSLWKIAKIVNLIFKVKFLYKKSAESSWKSFSQYINDIKMKNFC